ncbi:rhomboid family intramembrane serine protease [Vulgatibacter sp.]|uniref:rhomboid family intramembrane serine protease n=1 Tax=Vulgatibacter sp. TaxID=1971226 RepID=UPI003561C499
MFPLKDDIPTHHKPVITTLLIAANVLVYLFQHAGFPSFEASVFSLGVTPREVTTGVDSWPPSLAPPLATIFTSMFAHGGLFHIGGNMLFLWIFGNNVEDDMGPVKFLAFYLLCGVAAAGAQIVLEPASQIPMVGASGAIAGVLGAYLLLYPHARVLALVPIFFFIQLIWVPAVIFLVLWFVFQLFGGFMAAGSEGGGVAFWAHVGGFVMGLLLVRPFAGRIWRTDEEGAWRGLNPRSRAPWRRQRR